MMDRNYPISSFADPLVPPAQTAAWAYDRSTASVKPSLNYGATHPESELLHRQTYASIPQLPSYATAHHPIGLSGIFDTSLHTAGSNTTEASVMSFLSTIESRSPQAGPATASLLPQFRTPSWQTGINSSAATERFITGALPSSGTFPTPSALSTYQHPNTFSSRGFATAPSLAIQDPTFSPSTNGLMSPHDPLLPMKSTQGTVSTALTYDRLASTALTVSIPPQSSTYRSAQESAPHLLQPQFGPLPLGLVSQQQAPQPFSTSVFTSSIERALQRECSVIKHHQRPSSTQSVQTQLRDATQHGLQGYLTGRNEAPFPDPSQQPDIPSSLIADSTQVSSGGLQQKTTQAALEQTQAYSSVPSPRFSPVSSVKAKDCPSEKKQLPADITESQRASPDQLSQSYPSPTQKQSSVIAHQPQAYSPTQMPSLMSESSSQSYIASQNLTSSISHPQVYSSSQSEKLPSLYKTLTSFAGQSGNASSVSQSLIYSSSQQQTLPSAVHSEDYGIQVQALDPGNPSQSYSSSLSQGLPTVSYSAQSQGLVTVSPSQTYASGQSSSLTLQSLSFPSSRALNLPTQRSTQDYVLTQPSPGAGKAEDTLSPQPQKYLTPVQSPLFPSTLQSQALQNNRSSADLESPYCKRKLNSDVFVTTKQEVCEFPIQDLQTLQQTALDASAENLVGADMGVQSHVLYVVSKMDDRYNSQSVIRSNSRPEDHMVDMEIPESKKEDSTSHYRQHVTNANSQGVSDIKGNSSHTQSSHGAINAEELKTHSLRHKALDCGPQSHHMEAGSTQQQGPDQADQQGQFIRLSSTQVLMEPPRDLPMILLQRSILHPGVDPSKVSAQAQQVSVQYLQLDDQIASASVGQSQQQLTLPENPEILKMDLAETSKPLQQHMMPKDNYSQPNHHDTKHHFALSSICFPDSMLLADDRNILANVDDILAATAAACGVTPQDFVKATSEGEMPMLASRVDSNGHFQLVDARHISPSFSSQNSAIANIQPVTMTQNSSQMALGVHSFSKGAVLEQQGLQMVNSHTDPGLAASINSSMGEKMVKSSSRSDESEGENEEVLDMQRVHSNGMDYNPTGRSNSKESSPPPENDFNLAEQAASTLSSGNDHVQSGEEKSVKTEDAVRNSPNNGYPKKKPKYKGSAKLVGEEEDGQPKPVKRSGHGKRQNSRGTDTSSPSTSDSCYDGYQQQERMRQKIREVEEKQPEVKTGFIGSFLDFLKSGPKQQFSSPPMRMPNRTRKPSSSSRRPPCPLPLTFRPHQPPTPLMSPEPNGLSPSKRLDEELKKNLETLPSFSSDEDDSMGKNQDLQKSINSALFVLDQPAERRNKLEKGPPSETTKPDLPKSPSMPPSALKAQELTQTAAELSVKDFLKDVPLDELALQLTSVAIEGLTDEDLSDSGGEGMYRERDEFVVKIEDIECLKMTLKAGKEPPAIWKVQKALLQKFVPELRDGTRVFSATNSYLGYFGDAKSMYRRVYVKFIDTVNKREYVRVCNRKPRCKPMHSIRGSQGKSLHGPKAASVTSAAKPVPSRLSSRPKAKQPKVRAEPPPKKRKKWKEEFSSSPSESSPEVVSQDDEFTPPVPFASRFLNTRTMKETFKCFVELLISMAMDADMMEARERENDELLLPHVKKVDGMITDNRRRLLPKLRVGQLFKSALDSFPELSLVTELKKDGETPSFKVRLSGKAYNKRTMRPSKASSKLPLEYTVDKEKTQWITLYHSLQHYKYHTYLLCKDEITSLKTRGEDLGQEETVQLCLRDGEWVESLFDKFGQLLTQVQQTCL